VTPESVARVPDELVKVQELGARGDWVELDRHIGRLKLPNASPELRESLNELRTEARRLRGLEVLQAAHEVPWGKVADEAEVEAALRSFQENDPELAAQLRNDFVKSAEAGGCPDAARRLRDIKVRASDGGRGGPGQSPPEGGPLPTPEAGPGGVRPRPKEDAWEGLPPPQEKAAPSGPLAKLGVKEKLNQYADKHREAVTRHLLRLAKLNGTHKDQDSDDGRYEAEVRRELGRELTASERALIRVMRKKGKKPSEAAALLKGL
jgi:hypothetical protein